MEKRVKVMRLALEHIERAVDAVANFRENGASAEGMLVLAISEVVQGVPLTHCRAAGVDVGTFRTLAPQRSRALLPRLT